MANYGQNTQVRIDSIGLTPANIETIKSLPVGGYTLDDLSNFLPKNLTQLRSSLSSAKEDVDAVAEVFINDETNRISQGAAAGSITSRPIINLLQAISIDIQKSINNIDTKLNTPPADVIVLPEGKPIITVRGVNFDEVQLGNASVLPIIIENTGNDQLIITGYSGFGASSSYAVLSPYNWPEISNDNPIILQPGETKSLEVSFTPNAIVTYTSTIKFTSNATEGTNSASILGKGKAIPDPGVESVLGKKKTGSKRILTLKNVRETSVTSKNNPDIKSPYFDQQTTKHSAKLVVDIWQCYTPFGQENQIQKLLLENVVIADGIGSFWYERCDDFLGGLRPSYQYYYDTEQINDVLTWKALTRQDRLQDATNLLNPTNALLDNTNVNELFKFRAFIQKIKEELDSDDSYWGKFDQKNPNKTLCEPGNVRDEIYIANVVRTEFQSKSDIKIYGGFKENVQTRRNGITDNNLPDLLSSVDGNNIQELDSGFISKISYGRLSCLQPKTGCYIKSERELNDVKTYGDAIIKLITKSSVPEKIPNHACYRGYKATYIRSFNWERRWELLLDCLGTEYTEYEWRPDENLFNERGTIYDVWEDVEFAGTEIGFTENCIPIERPRVQEPYVDMSDNLGCYELQTTKIYMKYPDYNSPGDKDYIRGAEVLSIQDYSGLGPGIKLNRKVKRADCDQSPIRIFHPLKMGSDIITGRDNLITKGLFNGNQSPDSHFTSSYQNEKSKKYVYNIVDDTVLKNNKSISYYSVGYGNKYGSGSVYSGYETSDSTTKAIYSQNRLLALDSSETEFTTFTSGTLTSGRKDIYTINFNRDSLTDRLDPGNFEICLSDLSTPSKVMSFIDNSSDILEDKFTNDHVFSYFDIVSGSLENGVHDSGTGSLESNTLITTYGKVYPALGLIVFDAEKLDENLSFATDLSENVDTNNALKLFNSISNAHDNDNTMKARGSSNKKSNHYFIRVSAGTSNYSNNPTMVNELLTNNMIKHEFFKYNPVTYITTVGLYNDAEELLAVAKLSKPVKKTPETDILIKIRLNW
jgi:hypothetical protein